MFDRTKKWIPVFVLLGVVLWASIYFFASHSEAFEFIQRTVKTSTAVQDRIGLVENVRLSPFSSYRGSYSTSGTRVHMVVNAIGAKHSIAIDVRAIKKDGVWKITDALADGVPIALN